jgi:[protein-PII] uridylyltransferase
MPLAGFERSRPDQIAWQAASLREVAGRGCVARGQDGGAALEVFVHSPDRDGLFAAIVPRSIAWLPVSRRACRRPRDMVFDSFEVVPTDARQSHRGGVDAPLAGVGRFGDSVRPTRAPAAAPASFPPRRSVSAISPVEVQGGRFSLVCNDRPGLLADVTQVRQRKLRVHDARIAPSASAPRTCSDHRPAHQPLDETQQQALRDCSPPRWRKQ